MIVDAGGWIDSALRKPSPHVGGEIPVLAVLNHWTAGFSAVTSVQVLEDRGLCAQLVGPRDGGFIQCAPLHRYGAHAGASRWRGMGSCSGFMIGIEWANIGPVFWDDGRQRWFTGYFDKRRGLSVPYSGPEPVRVETAAPGHAGVTIQRHGGGWEQAVWFEPFSAMQIETALEAHAAIAARYPGCVAAVDHATVAPERKVDCLPWQAMIAGWGEVFAGRELPENLSAPSPAAEPDAVNYRRVQERLNGLGFVGADGMPLKIDGLMGPQTWAAIETFQRSRGLLPVGVLNHETIAALSH